MGTIKKENNVIFVHSLDKWRNIGELEKAGDVMLLKMFRDRSKHVMRVWNAYGFSKEVIDKSDWFDYILLVEHITDSDNKSYTVRYLIPREDIVLEGRLYETDGFERQYFVPLNVLERYRK